MEPHLLNLLPADCEQIYVGKRGGQPSPPQETINQVLVEHYQRGKQMVRLKSGDPWIFGRPLPEIQTLAAKHYTYEVVPGISTAIACWNFMRGDKNPVY